MALQKEYSSHYGTEHSQSYRKIIATVLDSNLGITPSQVKCTIHVFDSEEARLANKASLHVETYSFDYDTSANKNLLEYAYDKLKTHPICSGSLDV
jgi:hypothetical protein